MRWQSEGFAPSWANPKRRMNMTNVTADEAVKAICDAPSEQAAREYFDKLPEDVKAKIRRAVHQLKGHDYDASNGD